ncbi:hypothetical protein PR202_ga29726 [Eleusine coracana subsp. coracana]|uniref:Uncharacterized protein n=1 Tax=Eleusine coracana subsp. coracana TaxID=191504 RepID=A0AAV5DMM1_ELECO|nr:hypothetical protein PR202_ga29726 [Eleusine coracana subsp. coracana]
MVVMVSSLVLHDVVPCDDRMRDSDQPPSSSLLLTRRRKCGGRLGSGRTAASPPPEPSIAVTSVMVGRSVALSCTQSSATFAHRMMVDTSPRSPSVGSISSNARPSFHSCHACIAYATAIKTTALISDRCTLPCRYHRFYDCLL